MDLSSDSPDLRPKNSAARKLFDLLIADPCVGPFKVLPDPYLYPLYYQVCVRVNADDKPRPSRETPSSGSLALVQVITRPISFADINLTINGPHRYSLLDMQKDLRRMISNAKKYNIPESEVYQDALVLEVRGCVSDWRQRPGNSRGAPNFELFACRR
jgi:hypothetical protein